MTEHSRSMLQLQMLLTGHPLTSSYSTSMLREPRLVDPMSLPLTHQNQLEQLPLRFYACHGTKVVVWPHMPHVDTLTAVPAALAHIVLSTAQGQSQPSPQSSPAAHDPCPIPPASLDERELSFFSILTFPVCCYLVLSIFNDIARINSSFMMYYCMILFVSFSPCHFPRCRK